VVSLHSFAKRDLLTREVQVRFLSYPLCLSIMGNRLAQAASNVAVSDLYRLLITYDFQVQILGSALFGEAEHGLSFPVCKTGASGCVGSNPTLSTVYGC
jgi:hypothetical protein